ncbi:RHS repeat-associated protein [Undibacterium sp. GrIS 1.2]|uniref:Ig-like domain-containing protein n=1 Tax=Undibacterium sp. GrIS 1.2 TaxID=3143933 RepID=UPI003391E10A
MFQLRIPSPITPALCLSVLLGLAGLSGMSCAIAAPVVSITAPVANSKYASPSNITITANASNVAGATISKVDFYQGTTLLGSKTAAPYSYTWSSATTGSYSLTAKATNSLNQVTTSSAVAIIVNNPPTVSLTAPASNTSMAGKATVTLSANASDADGSIAKVDFYQGTTLLNSATSAPYSYSWANVVPGTYTLTAKATDNLGGVTTSSPVTLTVTNPLTSSLTAPVNNTSSTVGKPITLSATASTSKSGTTLSKVDFYQGTTLLGSKTAAPYSYSWTNATAGSYSLTAKVTDSQGLTQTSSPVSLSVINNTPPTISLSANPANAAAPATIILNASASDSDGTVTKVEFFGTNNSTSTTTTIATLSQAPYNTSWTNVAAGSYSMTAKATDNLGASTTSATVPVTVTAYVPKVYDIQSDHLNTPRVITDNTGAEVWRWDSDPFGATVPNENPQNTGVANNFRFNLRFPGQYYDKETNLHYNYFRDYDSQIGRYVESDPIGLKAGSNTYAYVEDNPVSKVDPKGLEACPGGEWTEEAGDFGMSAQVGGYISVSNVNVTCKSKPELKCKAKQFCVGGGPGLGAGAGGTIGGGINGASDSGDLSGWSNWQWYVAGGPWSAQGNGDGGSSSISKSWGAGVAAIRCITYQVKCTKDCKAE